MNDVWNRIIQDWINSYEAIRTLYSNHVIDEEDATELKIALLEDGIIEKFKSEVEE